jgi:hypothetical protein
MIFAAGLLAGCMASGTGTLAHGPESPAPPPDRGPLGSPFAERGGFVGTLRTPLLLDRSDLQIGTTVQFDRIPTAGEINDLSRLPSVAHVVLCLADWPEDLEPLQPLAQFPPGTDIVVILPGWPPSRAAAQAWSYVSVPLRLIVVVPGPPPSSGVVTDLNGMRSLERVIAQMDEPSRLGFERLQRPLSFRKIVE